jgi:hypothetical protein
MKASEFERPPLFLRENDPQIVNDPTWSTKIQGWMITASRIATGSRPRVLEDGPDVMNSDDEDAKEDDNGEELTGVYANGCSSLAESRMSEQLAQEVRLSATFATALPAPSSVPFPTYPSDELPSQSEGSDQWIMSSEDISPLISRQSTPMNSDDDESWMNPIQKKQANLARKMAERSEKSSAALLDCSRPASPLPLTYDVQPPAKAKPLTIVTASKVAQKDIPDTFKTEDLTSALTAQPAPQAQSKEPKGKKRIIPALAVQAVRSHTKVEEIKIPTGQGQESPVQKSSHPKTSRLQDARRQLGPSPPASPTGHRSRAGGFGGETGSGQTQGRGHAGPPSKPGS